VTFNSLEFLVFLPAVIALYFAIPARHRWVFLLISSYYFYMCWKVSYVVLLVASTLVDYLCARGIERSDRPKVRKRFMAASLIVNLGLLFTYKYYDFLNGSLRAVATWLGWSYPVPDLELTLPVGISFYTFQTLGYTIDVYRGRIKAEQSLFRFALYVTYFPQLVAGPIERAKNLIPQLRREYTFDYVRIRNGLCLIVWGLFKKLVIADRIAEYTDAVFANPAAHHGLQVWMSEFLFIVQLYCDFSGYSDIAIGSAAIMGVNLMQNFRQPLIARGIADLWTRWHISLTTWFRDYLYVYVGGRRGGLARMSLGIFVVFLANGLWHGANWTFVIFGMIHGIALISTYLVRYISPALLSATRIDRIPHAPVALAILIGQLVFMMSGNFFRAENVSDAWTLIVNSFDFSRGLEGINLYRSAADFWITIVCVILLYTSEIIDERRGFGPWLASKPLLFKWGLLLTGILSIIVLGKWNTISFIYFQF